MKTNVVPLVKMRWERQRRISHDKPRVHSLTRINTITIIQLIWFWCCGALVTRGSAHSKKHMHKIGWGAVITRCDPMFWWLSNWSNNRVYSMFLCVRRNRHKIVLYFHHSLTRVDITCFARIVFCSRSMLQMVAINIKNSNHIPQRLAPLRTDASVLSFRVRLSF